MTEAEWLICTDPQKMLAFLQGKVSDRKLRLFAVACCRRIWQFLKDERSRRLIETAESSSDDTSTLQQLRVTFDRAADAQEAIHHEGGDAVDQSAAEAVLGLRELLQIDQIFDGINEAVGEAKAGEAWERIYWTHGKDSIPQEAEHNKQCELGAAAEREVQVVLLRDIFGNSFRPSPPLSPAVLTWNDATVRRIAEGIYDERRMPEGTLDNSRLAILHDALLDAGCDNEELLTHLRSEGPHIRGCWALDQLLGKE